MILNFLWCLSPAVSCAVLNKGAGLSLPGLASPYRKHPLNWGPAATAAGLPSPYRKHPLNWGPAATAAGLPSPYRKHPLNWGPAATAAGLPSPYRKHPLNWGPAATAAGLPSPSSLARCHLSQSERPWQSVKFPVWNLYALLPQGEPKALRSDFTPLPRAPPLGELARSA